MDFFRHQEEARRNTGLLIVLFGLAVLAIAGLLYGVAMLTLVLQLEIPVQGPWNARIYLYSLLAVLGFVSVGSLWKLHVLAKGGSVVAERLGGRRLETPSRDFLERRIQNVVEEMAIASGTPVPPVYMLDHEEGINAFAAGHDPSDAVIGVTRGAVEKLTRDELQGVIAHEFSHILHGDMGLNLRLIGIIYGIELMALVGRAMLRGGGRSRGRKAGGTALLGLALLVIGAVGTLCGRLIRSAVCKQREFLADASAVQYTRNPSGISGALKKIGGLATGSRVNHPAGAEVSHLFFGSGGHSRRLAGLLATHPPLRERIRRLDPSFHGGFPAVPADYVAPWVGEGAATSFLASSETGEAAGSAPGGAPDVPAPPAEGLAAPRGVASGGSAGGERALPSESSTLLERLGSPGPEHLEHARALLAGLSADVAGAARDPEGARALVYALFMGGDDRVRQAQRSRVEEREGEDLAERVDQLREDVAGLDRQARLPLLEVISGTLARLEIETYKTFRSNVEALAEADREVDAGEWVLMGLLLRDLDRRFQLTRPARARYSRLSGLEGEVRFVLSALAHAGHSEDTGAQKAFDEAARVLGMPSLALLPGDQCPPRALEASLARLAELVPKQKQRLLTACATSVAADRAVTVGEAELFRVVANWMECPAPPLLPGQRLA